MGKRGIREAYLLFCLKVGMSAYIHLSLSFSLSLFHFHLYLLEPVHELHDEFPEVSLRFAVVESAVLV